MLEIASNDQKGVFQKEIAQSQALSNKYLDHIIHALKTAGLIINIRGKKSGYRLSRNPEQITLFDIHQAFEPALCLVECLSEDYECERRKICIARGAWLDLNLLIVNYLKSITLADILSGKVSPEDLSMHSVGKKAV
jgi:Rrf2 family protein